MAWKIPCDESLWRNKFTCDEFTRQMHIFGITNSHVWQDLRASATIPCCSRACLLSVTRFIIDMHESWVMPHTWMKCAACAKCELQRVSHQFWKWANKQAFAQDVETTMTGKPPLFHVLQCVAVWCSVLQCVAVCCPPSSTCTWVGLNGFLLCACV